jgi:hypothetical protein
LSRLSGHRAPPELLLDRSLGVNLAQSLRDLGYVVLTLRTIYGEEGAQGIADEYWIGPAAWREALILTKDDSIRRNWLARQVAFRSGARIFCLPNAQLKTPEMRLRILTNITQMVQRWQTPGPYLYAIHGDYLNRLWPNQGDSF